MGSAERRKGAGGEYEATRLLPGARKVSRMYTPGHDLEWRNRTIEVKRRKQGFATDYHWLKDAQLVLKRADRKPWLVTLELDTLLDLLDEARLDEI
jgi:hypothetical protein